MGSYRNKTSWTNEKTIKLIFCVEIIGKEKLEVSFMGWKCETCGKIEKFMKLIGVTMELRKDVNLAVRVMELWKEG